MGRKKIKPFFENVLIEALAAEGNSVAKVDGKVLFVQKGIPGDVVYVQVNKVRSGYMMGYITRIVTPSPMDTTRTFWEYFSPNSAMAPDFFASSMSMISVQTVRSA